MLNGKKLFIADTLEGVTVNFWKQDKSGENLKNFRKGWVKKQCALMKYF